MTAIHAQLPNDHMAVDLIGKLPTTSNGNVRILERQVCADYCPRILQFENGKEFVNEALGEILEEMISPRTMSKR